jgi:hypothetical protein
MKPKYVVWIWEIFQLCIDITVIICQITKK